MRTPKESFLLSGKAEAFGRLRSTVEFETACDYALLQLQSEMPPNTMPGLPTDPYIGIDANAQMVGARRLVEILLSLAEPIKEKETEKRPSLYRNPPK